MDYVEILQTVSITVGFLSLFLNLILRWGTLRVNLIKVSDYIGKNIHNISRITWGLVVLCFGMIIIINLRLTSTETIAFNVGSSTDDQLVRCGDNYCIQLLPDHVIRINVTNYIEEPDTQIRIEHTGGQLNVVSNGFQAEFDSQNSVYGFTNVSINTIYIINDGNENAYIRNVHIFITGKASVISIIVYILLALICIIYGLLKILDRWDEWWFGTKNAFLGLDYEAKALWELEVNEVVYEMLEKEKLDIISKAESNFEKHSKEDGIEDVLKKRIKRVIKKDKEIQAEEFLEKYGIQKDAEKILEIQK
ncbi:MAG: hypothetical protein PHQ80_03885 [Candidatus ainarchaeum sp.]|nr:hypothetical protein [Candidatus ainarchaeum sp.]